MPRLSLGFLLLGLVVLSGTFASAQEDASLFFDAVDVFVVNVEVIVTDSDGQPITGLSREDFEVFEDGELVDVANFFAVEGRQALLPGEDRGLAPELAPTPETQRLNLVVFVDNLNMRPENRNLIFGKLREHLEQGLDARDRVMLVSMNDSVKVVQTFTNDRESLLGTLEQLEKKTGAHMRTDAQQRVLLRKLQSAKLPIFDPMDPGPFETAEFDARQLATELRLLAEARFQKVQRTVGTLGQFTDSLAGMRGRKAILYVSDGLPLRGADSLSQAWVNKFETWITTEDADLRRELQELLLLGGSTRFDASRRFEELVVHASANQVAFYPISNGGRTARSRVSAEFEGGGATNGNGPMSQDVLALEASSQNASLLILAEGTGGVAFTNTTNIGGLLDRMGDDFSTFYSLGYTPIRAPDSEFHKVEIKVKRADAKVRHLKGYRQKDPAAHLEDLTLSALHYDLEDNQLEVRLDPGEQVPLKGNRFTVPVLVKIPFEKLLLVPHEEFHKARVSIYVVARNEKNGGVSPVRRIEVPIEIPNGQMLEALSQVATYPLQLEMKRGHQRISVGVRDDLANIDSTINIDINVGGDPAVPAIATEPSR